MTDKLMWLAIIGLGGFFLWLMFYSFYLVLFSKHDSQEKVKKTPTRKPL